jgi:hypothetical protein
VDVTHGGRATLRLGAISSTEVEYTGELATAEARFTSRIRVAIADGNVEISVDGEAPAWLLELARTTLRAAWRARLAGVAWPRRVSRWRAAKDEGRA